MWTPTTRAQHSRAGLRYGSDVTDAEWLILSPFLPPPSSFGCPRKWQMREIVNAIFYVLRGGIAWSLLPKDFPPCPTVYLIAVGTRITARPPHRTVRAGFPHTAPTSGVDGEALRWPGVKDSRLREPLVCQLLQSLPGRPVPLASPAACN